MSSLRNSCIALLAGLAIVVIGASSGLLHASSLPIVMSDKLKNSTAGRMVQRMFEQYIGERFAFTVAQDGKWVEATGKLHHVLIPKSPWPDGGSVEAVFTDVSIDGETQKGRQIVSIGSVNIAGNDRNARYPSFHVGQSAGLRDTGLIRILYDDDSIMGATGRVIAKYCQGQDSYCYTLFESVRSRQQDGKQKEIAIEPTLLMLKETDLHRIAVAGG
ncbi:MAG: hypothetical protein OYH77_08540 [Pseudomonadota bacterium]|nr:hypothetical protein [Pseudomonadota bacterium]